MHKMEKHDSQYNLYIYSLTEIYMFAVFTC